MTIKILTDKRGALQGMSVADIVRQVYGPTASYKNDADGDNQGVIERDGAVLDTVIDVHNAA
jgi:hypothetical protein